MAAIEKRVLGKSGIEVTKLGVGLWAIGGTEWGATDDKESLEMISAAADLGINFFDTADIYGDGHSEILLGQALQGRRKDFVIASKIGWDGFDYDQWVSKYATVEQLIAGVETSLERLQTDYLDLIQCHIDYREPHMEIFVEGFQKLQAQGKVRAYGLSTSDYDYLQAFNSDNKAATLQIDYSILNRTPEAEIFPYIKEHNLGVLTRGPLAMGILTGKFTAESKFGPGDFRQHWTDNPEENEIFLSDLAKVERLKALTEDRTLAHIAIQFVMQNPAVTVAIPGAKRMSQLKENVKAALLPELDAYELDYIDTITPPGGGRKIWPA
ncbi:MAG: aldo/keto reductase [Anaerolineaceae bacterium]|nr:aldo/keto reductase [Anaerolineaceae bacterium]